MLMKVTWYSFGTSFVAKNLKCDVNEYTFFLTSPFFLMTYCVVMRCVRDTEKWVCFKYDKI